MTTFAVGMYDPDEFEVVGTTYLMTRVYQKIDIHWTSRVYKRKRIGEKTHRPPGN